MKHYAKLVVAEHPVQEHQKYKQEREVLPFAEPFLSPSQLAMLQQCAAHVWKAQHRWPVGA